MSAPVFDVLDVFDEDYLYFYGPGLEESRDRDAELIGRLLDVQPGARVLDVACGHGRIANRLARDGATVSGLDATALFLDRARTEAAGDGLEVEYVEGDMRKLPWRDGSFDRLVSWFTSFGYFDDADNRGVLREMHGVLRAGGSLLMETNNLVELLSRWVPASVVERDGDLAIDRSRLDPTTGRATTERMIVRGGQVRRFTFSVRMFVAAELRDWLLEAGFSAVDFYGSDGEPLTAGSPRMITLASRSG